VPRRRLSRLEHWRGRPAKADTAVMAKNGLIRHHPDKQGASYKQLQPLARQSTRPTRSTRWVRDTDVGISRVERADC